jgi:L-rhamnose isomerase
MSDLINRNYESARTAYAGLGVDSDAALTALNNVPLSLPCWQGDDVAGFESRTGGTDGGIKATGNHPGKARNADELRKDLSFAASLIPGPSRINIHAIYAETGGRSVPRDRLGPEHFDRWIEWAKTGGFGLDFNPTFFAHPLADSGFTLSNRDRQIREFWIRHAKQSRIIASAMGSLRPSPCVCNLWIPDGSKDQPVSRMEYRSFLKDSLDEIYSSRVAGVEDAVESKVFGIGSESFVTGSHEFYLAYALQQKLLLCLDMGHFHPTESVADKISSLLLFFPALLFHVSRGVRWDSDHVVIQNDELTAMAQEAVRSGGLGRLRFALDYFDASLNRIAAWVIGARATRKALLYALLEPIGLMRKAEESGNLAERLGLLEECRTLPFGAIWDKYCIDSKVPVGTDWMIPVRKYASEVLDGRG